MTEPRTAAAAEEFDLLNGCARAISDHYSERNRRDPVSNYICEGCSEVPAAVRWPAKDMLLCVDCWKREWEADERKL